MNFISVKCVLPFYFTLFIILLYLNVDPSTYRPHRPDGVSYYPDVLVSVSGSHSIVRQPSHVGFVQYELFNNKIVVCIMWAHLKSNSGKLINNIY